MVELVPVSDIPRKTQNRPSKYEDVIKTLLANPRKAFMLVGGSASGLRRAVKNYGNGYGVIEVFERKGRVYARFIPNGHKKR